MLRLGRLLLAASGPAMTPRAALKILALSPSADLSHGVIKKAYVKQTLLCHPDLHPNDPNATDKFRSLSDALRVALKALEVRQGLATKRTGKEGQPAGEEEDDVYDSQAALEALRRAIISYRVHRESSFGSAEGNGGGASPAAAAHAAAAAAAGHKGAEEGGEEEEDVAFFSPSLEYVSAVCRKEALAMRRVQAFCDELPAILCGSSAAALFESVAFFHARYVQATSECVLRFSKDLPVIVRRVVKGRRRHVKNTHTKATTGFGTGSRPRQQRIEDMAMKPLVLVGALIFDLPEKSPLASAAAAAVEDSVTSTCGVSTPRDITVADELKCTIYPADSIATITEKLGKWEAASYDRLKLELAIVDACVFLSSLLNLSDSDLGHGGRAADDERKGENALATVPHLHVGHKSTERVLLTLQKLSVALCDAYDDSLDHAQKRGGGGQAEGETTVGGRDGSAPSLSSPASPLRSMDDKLASMLACLDATEEEEQEGEAAPTPASCTEEEIRRQRLRAAAMEAKSVEDDRQAAESVPLPVLVAECRRLATLAAPGLKGTINLTWSDNSDLVDRPEELTEADAGKAAASAAAGESPGFAVGRHRDCCAAEMIHFGASVELGKDLRLFLLRLRKALKTVVLEHAKGRALLDDVLRVRDATVNEEFIPEGEETEEEGRRYRYRGPIFNYARLHNMVTSRELVFWQLLHKHREYAARHAGSMNMLNVYLDCLPGQQPRHGSAEASDNIVSGWLGESADEDERWDAVVLTAAELEDPANFTSEGGAFRRWLEDVVEQSSLNKECRAVLDDAGIGYIRRDPALPLTNYLSFIKVFAQAAAVRAVLERRQVPATQRTGGGARVLSSDEVGISLVVGYRCDVRDGGRLLVPWSMDPNVLIALLSDGGAVATPRLE